jgi:hypothetical protein
MRVIEYEYTRVKRTIKNVYRAYKQRREWEYLCIHKRSLTKRPSFLVLPLLCGHVKGKLRCPSEITILLIHNHKKEPIMEKSLRYVGIENFVVLRMEFSGSWHNTLKILELKKFLDSDGCKTEYILYFDSDDVVLRDEPEKAIRYLQEEDCDLLLSNTPFRAGYECMPHIKEWTDQIANKNGYGQIYINTGVFIAKTSFLREVMDSAIEYITEHDLSPEEYRDLRRKGSVRERLPSFPKGVGSDQVILRYLHPHFYPRMKIDYKGRLALRKFDGHNRMP